MVRLKDQDEKKNLNSGTTFQFLMVRLKVIEQFASGEVIAHFNSLWFD